MDITQHYPIGCAGLKWGVADKKQWRLNQQIQRSYQRDVLAELNALGDNFELVQYGELCYQTTRYPLFIIKSKHWRDALPNVLVTGGVHGYETSGVQGAIRFAADHAIDYCTQYNFIIAPCISPWGYETINRWNPDTIDPNRSFYANSPAQEASLLITYINALDVSFICHIDLHETTDSDNIEFRPALIARDAIAQKYSAIPDGFYLVGDATKPVPHFQKAIINAVQAVTHIAPADEKQWLIGGPLAQFRVIN